MAMVARRAVRHWSVVTLVVAVALVAGISQTSFGHTILERAGLIQTPRSSTSLAFLNPRSPPEQLSSKQATVGVSFVIHNAGDTSQNYQWSMLLRQGQFTYHVAEGSARIAPGQEESISRSAKVKCTRGRVRIIVNLMHPAEFIDAWLACQTSKK